MNTQTKPTINLQGKYTLDGDYLKSPEQTLKVGIRHRPKKGQAKRFIGHVDLAKPEAEQFTYISSLYSSQGMKNTYELEHGGKYFSLAVTGLGEVEIKEKVREPALAFTGVLGGESDDE